MQRRPGEKVRQLMHHLNEHNLRRAFCSLDGSRASGIDHVTKNEYQLKIEENIAALADEIRRGGWRPKPAREVLIPKPQGGMRPLAIGCLEDKIVQTLVARILESIYEPSFHRRSYGFRRGKSPHQALGRLYETIQDRSRNCVVVEIDIEKFFNSVDQQWLMATLEQRIADEHFLRLIRRMLRNSILHQDGKMTENKTGTPQGSPVSPILANICLHELLDTWFQKNWAGSGEFVRYADDAVFVFTDEEKAQDFLRALHARMAEAGLSLNEDKTRIVPFDAKRPKGTITFLGFELYWGRKRGSGRVLKVKTSLKRLNRSMQAFYLWVKTVRNRLPFKKLWQEAAAKLRGHFLYYGVTWNESKLIHFYYNCLGAIFRWINRRSQKRSYTWERFKKRLAHQPLPRPPVGDELINISSEHATERKHKPKSRMPKLGTYGSVRSVSQKLAFT